MKEQLEVNDARDTIKPTVVLTTDLGPNNEGVIGPADDSLDQVEKIRYELPEYVRLATNRWRCVDGRLPEGGLKFAEGYADSQIAGGIEITDTAADMMDQERVSQPGFVLSQLVKDNTLDAIADGQVVVVHGDDHADEEGCGANVKMRPTLLSNARNIDIVAPRVWTVSKVFGLERWIDEDDVTKSIVTGGQTAETDTVWDATPTEVVEIVIENGGEYEKLVGKHNEQEIVAVLDEEAACDGQQFIEDHSQDSYAGTNPIVRPKT